MMPSDRCRLFLKSFGLSLLSQTVQEQQRQELDLREEKQNGRLVSISRKTKPTVNVDVSASARRIFGYVTHHRLRRRPHIEVTLHFRFNGRLQFGSLVQHFCQSQPQLTPTRSLFTFFKLPLPLLPVIPILLRRLLCERFNAATHTLTSSVGMVKLV